MLVFALFLRRIFVFLSLSYLKEYKERNSLPILIPELVHVEKVLYITYAACFATISNIHKYNRFKNELADQHKRISSSITRDLSYAFLPSLK